MDVDLSVDRLRALWAVRICGRGAETRATCGGCCLGRDAPGFRESGKYAGTVEAGERGCRFSESSRGVSECDERKWNGDCDRSLSRPQRFDRKSRLPPGN